GFGNTIDFDPDLVIPNKSKTLNEGAIEPWTKPKYRALFTELKRFAKDSEIPLDIPWSDLTRAQRDLVFGGDRRFLGVHGFFAHLERKKYKLHVRVFLSRYRGYSVCGECRGSRLRTEARQVRIGTGAGNGKQNGGKNICDICALTVEAAAAFFASLQLTP